MKAIVAAMFLAPALAFAKPAPVSLRFDAVSLVAFGEATFKAIMNRDFVVSPEVVGLDRRITINVKSIDAADVPHFVESLLAQQGIETTLKDGVYYLNLKRQVDQESLQRGSDAILTSARADVVKGSQKPVGGASEQLELPVSSSSERKADDESSVYAPQHRPSEFMVSVLVTAFGRKSAMQAGPHIVLTGSKVDLVKMQAILNALDTAPKKVDVSASWIEVAQNSASGRGISLVANVLGAKLGASIGAVNSGAAISLKNTNFELVIDALNTDGRFNQVSNSRITGDDYEKLNLTVGDETPTVASSGRDNAGNPVQNVVYRPSGVIIDVLPKVLAGGGINMAIDGQISSFKATSTGVTGSPTLIKRQVKTVVTVGDGEVLIIGGLSDTQNSATSSAWSFLPSSWATKSGNSVQTDLVLILSAKVSKPGSQP